MCKGCVEFFWGEAVMVLHAKEKHQQCKTILACEATHGWTASSLFRSARAVKERAARNAGAVKEEFNPWDS